jgi:hypothetical protein
VRYGALATNPVRDADRLTARPAKEPRALTLEERQLLLKKLAADPVACAACAREDPYACIVTCGNMPRSAWPQKYSWVDSEEF